MTPRVCIIIPTYNRAHLVPRAIDSVIAQTVPDWELIVMNIGSTDNTTEVLAKYVDSRIRILTIDHTSKTGAPIMQARQMTSAPWVTFLCDDDEFLPERLEYHLREIERRPDIGATYCFGEIVHMDGSMSPHRSRHLGAEGNIFNLLLEELFIPQTIICKPEYFVVSDDVEFSDWFAWLTLAYQTRIGCTPRILARFHESPGQRQRRWTLSEQFGHTHDLYEHVLKTFALEPEQHRRIRQLSFRARSDELWCHIPWPFRCPFAWPSRELADLWARIS